MLKNVQTYFKILRCEDYKIFVVCLANFQHNASNVKKNIKKAF